MKYANARHKDTASSSISGRTLRQRAEEIAVLPPEDIEALSPDEIRQTLHDLRVHQIELEMQNEELRRTQVELDAARARYFDLYNLAPVGYCTLSEKGLILEANLTAATLLGAARNALVKQPITRFILKEDQDIYYLHCKQLLETGEPQACELRMVREDGAQLWARLEAAAQDADGAPVQRVVMSDITERKRAEETLRRQNEYLNALHKTTVDLISPLDLSSLLEKIVKRAGLLLGTSSGYLGLVDSATNELRPQIGLGELADALTFQVKPGKGLTGTVWQTSEPLVVNDYDVWTGRVGEFGHGAIHAAIGVPLVSGSQVLGVLGLAYDAKTNRTFGYEVVEFLSRFARLATIAIENARLVEALRKSNAEIQAHNKELDSFGHTVAHDLKNPLSTIIISAYLLGDSDTALPKEESFRIAQTIKQMGLKMDSIIEELMLLAGLRRAEVKMEPLNMIDIMTDVLRRLTATNEKSGAEIVCPPVWPEALGHAPWVEEVWVNYISNAIKYGGNPPSVELGAERESDIIRFWVHDNGSGMTADEQVRLFEPFERLEQTHLSGHGLGLSIVRRIVERMGGQVSVNSTGVACEGSTFSFTLPSA